MYLLAQFFFHLLWYYRAAELERPFVRVDKNKAKLGLTLIYMYTPHLIHNTPGEPAGNPRCPTRTPAECWNISGPDPTLVYLTVYP